VTVVTESGNSGSGLSACSATRAVRCSEDHRTDQGEKAGRSGGHFLAYPLQRASTLVVQKSIKEGFGLTVTEALWKGKATIAGAVGGIPNQVIDKRTGMLVHSVEGCAYQIRYLLTHPEFAVQLGRNGREHVKENFLMTTNVRRWLLLMRIMLGWGTV